MKSENLDKYNNVSNELDKDTINLMEKLNKMPQELRIKFFHKISVKLARVRACIIKLQNKKEKLTQKDNKEFNDFITQSLVIAKGTANKLSIVLSVAPKYFKYSAGNVARIIKICNCDKKIKKLYKKSEKLENKNECIIKL